MGHTDSIYLEFSLLSVVTTVFLTRGKLKVRVIHPFSQPGSYCDRSSALSLAGVEPTQKGEGFD